MPTPAELFFDQLRSNGRNAQAIKTLRKAVDDGESGVEVVNENTIEIHTSTLGQWLSASSESTKKPSSLATNWLRSRRNALKLEIVTGPEPYAKVIAHVGPILSHHRICAQPARQSEPELPKAAPPPKPARPPKAAQSGPPPDDRARPPEGSSANDRGKTLSDQFFELLLETNGKKSATVHLFRNSVDNPDYGITVLNATTLEINMQQLCSRMKDKDKARSQASQWLNYRYKNLGLVVVRSLDADAEELARIPSKCTHVYLRIAAVTEVASATGRAINAWKARREETKAEKRNPNYVDPVQQALNVIDQGKPDAVCNGPCFDHEYVCMTKGEQRLTEQMQDELTPNTANCTGNFPPNFPPPISTEERDPATHLDSPSAPTVLEEIGKVRATLSARCHAYRVAKAVVSDGKAFEVVCWKRSLLHSLPFKERKNVDWMYLDQCRRYFILCHNTIVKWFSSPKGPALRDGKTKNYFYHETLKKTLCSIYDVPTQNWMKVDADGVVTKEPFAIEYDWRTYVKFKKKSLYKLDNSACLVRVKKGEENAMSLVTFVKNQNQEYLKSDAAKDRYDKDILAELRSESHLGVNEDGTAKVGEGLVFSSAVLQYEAAGSSLIGARRAGNDAGHIKFLKGRKLESHGFSMKLSTQQRKTFLKEAGFSQFVVLQKPKGRRSPEVERHTGDIVDILASDSQDISLDVQIIGRSEVNIGILFRSPVAGQCDETENGEGGTEPSGNDEASSAPQPRGQPSGGIREQADEEQLANYQTSKRKKKIASGFFQPYRARVFRPMDFAPLKCRQPGDKIGSGDYNAAAVLLGLAYMELSAEGPGVITLTDPLQYLHELSKSMVTLVAYLKSKESLARNSMPEIRRRLAGFQEDLDEAENYLKIINSSIEKREANSEPRGEGEEEAAGEEEEAAGEEKAGEEEEEAASEEEFTTDELRAFRDEFTRDVTIARKNLARVGKHESRRTQQEQDVLKKYFGIWNSDFDFDFDYPRELSDMLIRQVRGGSSVEQVFPECEVESLSDYRARTSRFAELPKKAAAKMKKAAAKRRKRARKFRQRQRRFMRHAWAWSNVLPVNSTLDQVRNDVNLWAAVKERIPVFVQKILAERASKYVHY